MNHSETVAAIVRDCDDLEFDAAVIATDVHEGVAVTGRSSSVSHRGEDPGVPDAVLPRGSGDPDTCHTPIMSYTYEHLEVTEAEARGIHCDAVCDLTKPPPEGRARRDDYGLSRLVGQYTNLVGDVGTIHAPVHQSRRTVAASPLIQRG